MDIDSAYYRSFSSAASAASARAWAEGPRAKDGLRLHNRDSTASEETCKSSSFSAAKSLLLALANRVLHTRTLP